MTLKRSGFRKPERPERKPVTLTPIRQLSVQPAKLPVQTPKFPYQRSPALMRAYGQLPCQHCGSESGSVGAHSNHAIHGKGKSIKASDEYCASLCTSCHFELDQGKSLMDYEKKQLWFDAHRKTVQKLVILKLWPHDVKIPSLDWPESW